MSWRWLFQLDRNIGKFEVVVLSVVLVAVTVLFSLQTVLRNFFDTGILWINPLVQYSMLWIMMLGGSIATLDQRHMSIDITSKLVSKRNRHILMIVVSISSAIVAWYMAQAAMDYIYLMKEGGDAESVYLPIPQWISKMIIPFGFFMICTRFVLRAIEHFLILKGVDVGLPPETEDAITPIPGESK